MVKKTEEVVLSVARVSKNFHLPHEKDNSIKSRIVNVFKVKDTEVDVQHALKDISFDIKKGEFFGILGRNGSGKSTLLKILAEIYQPTTGFVNHYGKLVPFIELGVGFNPELTGRENVYLNGALLGFSRKEIDARYDDIVKFAELEDFMDQKLKNYSSGMQVRLAFSVATRAEADILLVDEVLAVGDADFQRKCYDFFKSLKRSGKTVVFVTHDMGAVREYCDRAILINEGKVTHQGDAVSVSSEYLKLFNKTENSQGSEAQSERWGNGQVSFGSIVPTLTKDTFEIAISVVNGKEPIEGLNLGVDIHNEDGKLVAGTELIRDFTQGISLRPSETKKITIAGSNLFGGGRYALTASLRTKAGTVVCDYWENAAIFTNTHEYNQYFPVVLPAKFKVDQEKK